MKTVFITGSSSGIGNATARLFFDKGWNVIATMRDISTNHGLLPSDRMHLVELDVTDSNAIEKVVSVVCKTHGNVDVLINNAGYGVMGPLEYISNISLQQQFTTNVIGLIEVTKAFIPYMRAQNKGSIINISSMMGRISFPFASPYVASKWAVEGFSEALQIELRPYNIKVKLIEPGTIKTDFFDNVDKVPLDKGPYQKSWTAVWRNIYSRGAIGEPSLTASKVIYKAATSRSSRMRYSVDPLSKLLPFLRAISPLSLFQFILSKTVR